MSDLANVAPATPAPSDHSLEGLAKSLAAEDGTVIPAAWLGEEDPKPQPQPTATPAEPSQLVKIGDVEYKPEELAQLVDTGKAAQTKIQEYEAALAQSKEAIETHKIWLAMPDSVRQEIADLVERRANGEMQTRQGWPEIPTGTVMPQVEYDHMSQESQMLYGLLIQTMGAVRQLGTTVNSMTSHVAETAREREDALLAEALKAKGIEATPALIQRMRDSGITDPVKAVDFFSGLMRQSFAQGAKKAEEAPKPTENVPSNTGNTYDDNDPNLTADEEIRLLQQGFVPLSGQLPG
jgi:hypothetical protein